jgi:hypothetical protein
MVPHVYRGGTFPRWMSVQKTTESLVDAPDTQFSGDDLASRARIMIRRSVEIQRIRKG